MNEHQKPQAKFSAWYFLAAVGKAREIEGGVTNITFADVGGIDEVEVELKELIAFLKQPDRRGSR